MVGAGGEEGSGTISSTAVKEPEEPTIIRYEGLLKIRKDLVSIKNFAGKLIKEVRFIPEFDYTSNRGNEASLVIVFEDDSISVPLGNIENQSYTEGTYDGLIEVGVLTEEDKKRAIDKRKEMRRLNEKINQLVEHRGKLQKDLSEHRLGRKKTIGKYRQIEGIEVEIEGLQEEREKTTNSFP